MTILPGQGAEPPDGWAPRGIDTKTPSTARMYDYLLGGKNHYPADREGAESVLAAMPDIATAARENRKFLQRAVRVMVDAGIRQFLDIGTGLPTQENVHEVAQRAHPDAAVVYVDHDPVVLAHARALLVNDAQTAVVEADLRSPGQILANDHVRDFIDFEEPVGVLMVAILHFLTDDENPAGIVAAFRDALPTGSYLALSHGTAEHVSEQTTSQGQQIYERATSTVTPRSREQVRDLFTGFELVEPGIVAVDQWSSTTPDAGGKTPPIGYAGLARKP